MTKKPRAEKPPADPSALTCKACRMASSIVVTRQRNKMLEWAISCSKLLGGCGRWVEVTGETVRRGGPI